MAQTSIGVKVAANGRMVLPVAIRRELGLVGDSKLILKVDDGKVTLHSISDGVRRAQELYRKYATKPSTVDDFLAERRAEAARENGDNEAKFPN